MNPTFSASQNLRTAQPTPSISTREFTILPGVTETLKIVGTSVYVSQCYTVDAEGYQLPAAVRITLGHCEPFLAETGTNVEFKYYGTPFNQISISGLGTEKIFVVLQVGYMLECRKGEAGTAGAIALLREKIEENKDALEEARRLLDEIGPATSEKFGLVKYLNEELADSSNAAPVLRNDSGQMLVASATVNRAGVLKLGTSREIPANGGLLGKTANGACGVRFAEKTLGGVVFLASGADDTRANAVFTVPQVNSLFSTLLARIQELENALANLSTGAAMILESGVGASAQTLSVPLAGEDFNGEISVETNADWISADASGNIQIEEIS